ncbi:MAG: L-rhamnose isomerase [Candidatus Aminicenantaceae bacterium]
MNTKKVEEPYKIAREEYAHLNVDTDKALKTLEKISLSLPCWQGDDLGGFEKLNSDLGGSGLRVTGNYPGKARTINELRADLGKAYFLIPGHHRLSLHAIYGEFGE